MAEERPGTVPAVGALDEVGRWPVRTAAVGVVTAEGVVDRRGPQERAFPLASVTKLLTAAAVLVAVEEGAIALSDAAGPPGATVRHLLAHASGLPPEGATPVAPPGRRRIYSNAGFEALARHLEAGAGMPFATYLDEGVVAPLGLEGTRLDGSAARGASAPLCAVLALAKELLAPTLVHPSTLAEATRVAFPGLRGVLPGFGMHDPNDWGLGFELRGAKSPHWTGAANSPRTFGHFGRSGTFLWVDPDAGVACACLTDRDFGPWAAEAWPRLADAVLADRAA